jgi:hypothetical protein
MANCLVATAQSLKIVGDTVQVYKISCLELGEYTVPVKNMTNAPLKVRVRKEHISITPKHEVYFCWVKCYGSSVFYSPEPGSSEQIPELKAGKDTNMFHAYVDPRIIDDISGKVTGGIEGVSEARYHFYNDEDPSDEATVLIRVEAKCVNSVDEQPLKSNTFIAPNPADEQVRILFSESLPFASATLQIFDALGKHCGEIDLKGGEQEVSISTSTMPTGVYSYAVVSNKGIVYSRGIFSVAR